MAEVLLFHHVRGLTTGVVAFADALRDAGHTVHTPDLFDGAVFDSIDAGLAHTGEVGVGAITARALALADELPPELVYAGFSMGVAPAQQLAQTRPGASGALLFESCLPVEEFSPGWPSGVPVQVHGMSGDPFFAGEGDIDAARELVAAEPTAELFVYPGDVHLFADASLETYDPEAATLLTDRVLGFLARV